MENELPFGFVLRIFSFSSFWFYFFLSNFQVYWWKLHVIVFSYRNTLVSLEEVRREALPEISPSPHLAKMLDSWEWN